MDLKSKTIIMTGATGFIGSAVLREFLSVGCRVIVLLRKSSNIERLNEITGFEVLTYKSLDDEDLISQLREKKPDVFLQMAWSGVLGKDRNELFQIRENVSLTMNSVELSSATGCAHWIGIGSQAEYGNQNKQMHERSPLEPTTIYGKAKVACCWTALGLCQTYDLNGTWLRLFDPYGPGDRPEWLIPYLIKEMSIGNAPRLTSCEQLWDYIYIDDVARAIKMVVESEAVGIYNLGSGKTVSLKKVVEIIQRLVNVNVQPGFGDIEYRKDQVMCLHADISKLSGVTGWQPTIELEEGLRKTVEYFKEYHG